MRNIFVFARDHESEPVSVVADDPKVPAINTRWHRSEFAAIRSNLDDKYRLQLNAGSVDDYDMDRFWMPKRHVPGKMREARFSDAVWLRTTIAWSLSTAVHTLILYKNQPPLYTMDKIEQDEQAVGPWHTMARGYEDIAARGGLSQVDLGKIALTLELEVKSGLPGKINPIDLKDYHHPTPQSTND